MSLKDDLKETIRKSLHKVYPMHSDQSFTDVTDVLLENIWATLEDVVGSAQEHLFQQLTAARAELNAARRREEALVETVRDLQSQLHRQVEGSSAE